MASVVFTFDQLLYGVKLSHILHCLQFFLGIQWAPIESRGVISQNFQTNYLEQEKVIN